jgi:hypothetical protein
MAVSFLSGLTRSRQNSGGSCGRLRAYAIQNGHTVAMYKGGPVKISTASGAGTLDVATNNAAVVGVAQSFHWIDKLTNQPQYGKYFPAATSNKGSLYNEGFTTPFALVDDDPHGTWIISTETSVSAGNVGSLARVTNAGAGSTFTGRSTAELDLSGTAVSAGNAMFRIVGLYKVGEITSAGGEENDWNSTSTLVEVVFSNHVFG